MIEIKPTQDMDLVKAVMLTPEIWGISTEDGTNPDNFNPGFDSLTCWFECIVNGKTAGVILAHNDNITTIKIHPYLFKEYRINSRGVLKEFFKWFLDNAVFAKKINVSIPFNRKIVYNFAKKIGFKDEGVNRASFLSGGILHDQWMLGITKEEIKRLLCPA